MKKIFKKSVNIIPYLFLLIAFILIISMATSIRKGETPSIFGRAIFLVVTPSMEDTIMVGDIIFVDMDPGKFVVGDIITFRQPTNEDIVITHRIVEIEEIDGIKYYTTMGDNNFESLDWEIDFLEELIIGKYVSKSGLLGDVYQFVFASGFNLIFIVIILVFVTIGGMEISNIVKQLKIAKEKQLLEEKEKMLEEELNKLRKAKEDKEE
ncbi:signal peptidase I [Mycoplasmatota bacterium WC30]